PGNVFVQRSPLSNFPQQSAFSGVVGYFQLDDDNHFSTPLLPDARAQALAFGLSDIEIVERESAQSALKDILVKNGLLREQDNVSALDKLEESARVVETQIRASNQQQALEEFKLDDTLRKKSRDVKASPKKSKAESQYAEEVSKKSSARFEKELLSDRVVQEQEMSPGRAQSEDGFSFLESRISGFSATLLESGHVLFYRQVWQENQRYLQGFVINQSEYIEGLIANEYQASLLADMSTLAVVWQNQVVEAFSGRLQNNRSYLSPRVSLGGSVLHKQNLPTPLNDWELLFTIDNLPTGAGARVILFAASSFLL